MTAANLYAPPKSDVKNVSGADCTRDGKFVIVPVGSNLPKRCIICNDTVHAPIKEKKVYWHSPWLYLLILINIVIYIIVGVLARKSFPVAAGMCTAHASRHRMRVGIVFTVFAVSLVSGFMLGTSGHSELAGLAILVTLLSVIPAVFVSRTVYAKKITKDFAKLGGCKEPFLASLEQN